MTHEAELSSDSMGIIVNRLREINKLDAMWGGVIPAILMTEEELDSFLLLPFGEDDRPTIQVGGNYKHKGEELGELLYQGTPCEESVVVDGQKAKCENDAIAAVGWFGIMMAEEVLACRDHIRSVHEKIVTQGILGQGWAHKVTLNGRIIPQWEKKS